MLGWIASPLCSAASEPAAPLTEGASMLLHPNAVAPDDDAREAQARSPSNSSSTAECLLYSLLAGWPCALWVIVLLLSEFKFRQLILYVCIV